MKKRLYSVAFLVVVSSLLVAGTFAWTNFSAQIINRFFGQGTGDLQNQQGPGGTLHNDFIEGEDYRDIYIENWGTEPMIVRIFLSEYMEIGPGAGDLIGNNEAVSLVEGALLSDQTTWTPFPGDMDDVIRLADAEASSFRDYWRWTMGGQKYFFPAPEEYRGNPNDDIEFVSRYSPPHLSPSDAENVQRTLLAEVITMDEWMSQGEPTGHFWVVDTNGFSYWAAPLLPGEATGLLLHKIEQIRTPVYNYFYALNVQGHMATIDDAPDNYERMLANASEDASRLINQLAEEIRLMDDEPGDPGTPTIYLTIEDYDGEVHPSLELIFEDEHNRFYLSSVRSSFIMLTFEDGQRMSLRQAIDDGLVTAADLIANGLELIVEPRLVPTPNTPGPQTTATPSPPMEWDAFPTRMPTATLTPWPDGFTPTLTLTPTPWPDGFTPTPWSPGPGWQPSTPTPGPDGFTPTPWYPGTGFATPLATPTPPSPTPWPEGFTPTPRTITHTPTPWAGTPTPTTWPEGFPTPISRTPTPFRTPTPWAGTPTETPWPEGVTPMPIVTHTPTYTPTPFPPAPTLPPYWWLTPTTAPMEWTPTPYAGSPSPTPWPEGGAVPTPTSPVH